MLIFMSPEHEAQGSGSSQRLQHLPRQCRTSAVEQSSWSCRPRHGEDKHKELGSLKSTSITEPSRNRGPGDEAEDQVLGATITAITDKAKAVKKVDQQGFAGVVHGAQHP